MVENLPTVVTDRCLMLSAQHVARRHKFHLNQIRQNQFIAETALKNPALYSSRILVNSVCRDAGDVLAKNEAVNIFGPFIRVNAF